MARRIVASRYAERRVPRVLLGSALVALAVTLVPGLAVAQSFTVGDGQTVGPQVVTGVGDVGVVDLGGEVAANGVPGIELQASDQRVENAGSIVATGDAAAIFGLTDALDVVVINTGSIVSADSGMVTLGARAQLSNAGLIVVQGEYDAGMSAIGADSLLINEGEIQVLGQEGLGFGVTGAGSIARNYGTIGVDGIGARGVWIVGDDVLVENFGSILANSFVTTGIWSTGTGATIVNHGEILASNEWYSTGVSMSGANSSLINYGRISATVDDAMGAIVEGSGSTVENFGLISAVNGIALLGDDGVVIDNAGTIETPWGQALIIQSGVLNNSGTVRGVDAIRALFGNSTLNLLAGSVIEGRVQMYDNGNTVNFGPGLSARMTFEGTLPQTITTSGNPYIVDGNTVTVFDRGGLALTDDMLFGLASSAGGSAGQGPEACLDSDGTAQCGVSVWLAGLGGLSGNNGSDDLATYRHRHGGLEAGIDIAVGGVTAGAFLSGVEAVGEIEAAQRTEMSGGIVGGHVAFAANGLFADLSASFGVLDMTSRRQVADNMVDGGVNTAEASSLGRFLSPALTAGTHVALGEQVLTPSATLRYTQLDLDGYTESGATDDFAIDARTVSELALRAQLALMLAPMLTEGGEIVWSLRAGADASRREGTVSANLVGEEIGFETGSAGDGFGALVGANLDYRIGESVNLSGDVEYTLDTAGSGAVTARASLSAAF